MSKFTAKKRSEFLEVLAHGGSVQKASAVVRISRQAAYKARGVDKQFAAAWDSAIESGTDLLEDEAIRRGRDGVRRPMFYQGKRCGYVQEYSDTLLIFTLKARRPEKFRDNATPGHGNEGQLDELLKAIQNSPVAG